MILCVNFCACVLRMCIFFYNFASNFVQTMQRCNSILNFTPPHANGGLMGIGHNSQRISGAH